MCLYDPRNALAAHLKDLRHVDGGDRQLTSWLKEEGFQTSVRSVVQVIMCLICPLLPEARVSGPLLKHASVHTSIQ